MGKSKNIERLRWLDDKVADAKCEDGDTQAWLLQMTQVKLPMVTSGLRDRVRAASASAAESLVNSMDEKTEAFKRIAKGGAAGKPWYHNFKDGDCILTVYEATLGSKSSGNSAATLGAVAASVEQVLTNSCIAHSAPERQLPKQHTAIGVC